MSKMKNLTGQKFGRLTVIRIVGKDKFQNLIWLCKCDCGNEVSVRSASLIKGRTVSCGCYNKEKAKYAFKTHGLSKTRLYRIWNGIKNRCFNENIPKYKNYGNRGIFVCDEWKNDFMSFYNWSMDNGYDDNLSIDRIDYNGNYEPNNCRWITNKEQSRNKRNNNLITYNNETHCISEWAEILGFKSNDIYRRLKLGWCVEKIFNTPIKELKTNNVKAYQVVKK